MTIFSPCLISKGASIRLTVHIDSPQSQGCSHLRRTADPLVSPAKLAYSCPRQLLALNTGFPACSITTVRDTRTATSGPYLKLRNYVLENAPGPVTRRDGGGRHSPQLYILLRHNKVCGKMLVLAPEHLPRLCRAQSGTGHITSPKRYRIPIESVVATLCPGKESTICDDNYSVIASGLRPFIAVASPHESPVNRST